MMWRMFSWSDTTSWMQQKEQKLTAIITEKKKQGIIDRLKMFFDEFGGIS